MLILLKTTSESIHFQCCQVICVMCIIKLGSINFCMSMSKHYCKQYFKQGHICWKSNANFQIWNLRNKEAIPGIGFKRPMTSSCLAGQSRSCWCHWSTTIRTGSRLWHSLASGWTVMSWWCWSWSGLRFCPPTFLFSFYYNWRRRRLVPHTFSSAHVLVLIIKFLNQSIAKFNIS